MTMRSLLGLLLVLLAGKNWGQSPYFPQIPRLTALLSGNRVTVPNSFAQEDSDGREMAQIPAGEFWMGRAFNWLLDELGMHLRMRLDDQPVHLVYLDAFWIDKYEVSNQDYARFVQATGHRKPFHWIGGKVPAGQEKF